MIIKNFNHKKIIKYNKIKEKYLEKKKKKIKRNYIF